jgi:arsenate reductase-like glutaredoxin family protein
MAPNLAASTAPALQPHIARHILLLRSQRVMLDAELAALYGVETKVLVQSIKRNLERFPADFMFQLDTEEFANLRSQSVTSSSGYGGRRYAPYAFTEQGVAMLSSVLNSPRAIAINIEIMRAFVQIRATAATHQDLAKQLTELQDKTESLAMSHETFSRNTKVQLREVFETLRELMTPPASPKRPIGFVHPQDAVKPKGKAVKASAAKKTTPAAPVKASRKK